MRVICKAKREHTGSSICYCREQPGHDPPHRCAHGARWKGFERFTGRWHKNQPSSEQPSR